MKMALPPRRGHSYFAGFKRLSKLGDFNPRNTADITFKVG